MDWSKFNAEYIYIPQVLLKPLIKIRSFMPSYFDV